MSVMRLRLEFALGLLLVILQSSTFFGDICTFFPPSSSYESSCAKSLHYKTIRSEASGNAAGIRCPIPTAAVRNRGWEGVWMGGAKDWQHKREDCKNRSMTHRSTQLLFTYKGIFLCWDICILSASVCLSLSFLDQLWWKCVVRGL